MDILWLLLAVLVGIVTGVRWRNAYPLSGGKKERPEPWPEPPRELSSADLIALKEKLKKQYSGTVPFSKWIKPPQDDPIHFLQPMQKLEVNDGDIVVIHHSLLLAKEYRGNLKNYVEKLFTQFGIKVHVMVLEEGMDIGILTNRKENA